MVFYLLFRILPLPERYIQISGCHMVPNSEHIQTQECDVSNCLNFKLLGIGNIYRIR